MLHRSTFMIKCRSSCNLYNFRTFSTNFTHATRNLYVKDCFTLPGKMNYSSGNGRNKGFLSGIFDNIKEEFARNKQMKENIMKFREEARKLEESEALTEAKKRYKSFEDETKKSSQYLKEKVGVLGEILKDSEIGKQASQFSKQLSDHASRTADAISKKGSELSQSDAFKSMSAKIGSVKDEIDEVTNIKSVNVYRTPSKLRKRSIDPIESVKSHEDVTADTASKNVVLHKDSKWYQSWQNFKDNSAYMNKIFEMKTRYDESNNLIVRAARTFTDFASGIMGKAFSQTEASEALTEITKIDPEQIQTDMAPNILGSISLNELDVLRDWCYEAVYNVLIQPIKQSQALNCKYVLKIVDMSEVEYVAAKILEQGPVVVVTFTVQQVQYVTDANGKVVEGSKDKPVRILHIWAFCRDLSIPDPTAGWRLIDVSMHERGEMLI